MANAKQIDFLAAGVLDATGEPLSSGLVYTYEAGTTTNKTCYTASDKSANAANPIVLDAYGKATIYADGNYKFLLKTSGGTTVATLDNFEYSIPVSTDAETVEVTAAYTATTSDYLIMVNTAAGAVTITLPTAIGNEGLEFLIIKTSADANAVTIDPYGAQTIGGSATKTLSAQYQSLGVMADDANWQMTTTPGVVTLTGTETLTNKTLTSPVLTTPQINDTTADHQYIIAVSELAADRIVTLPLLLAGDEVVFKNHIATLVGKTLTTPTITTPVINAYALLKNAISGLAVTNDTDTEHDISIAAGSAYDGTGAVEIILASALVKKADATWAVGSTNGGMAAADYTANVANGGLPLSGTVHLWLIKRSDTGVVDALFNDHVTSALAPTLPAGYDYKRRIASFRTDGSGNIINGDQWGTGNLRVFMYDTPILDIDDDNPGTAAVTRALSVPSGIIVRALFNYNSVQGGAATIPIAYFSSLANADLAPSASSAPLGAVGTGTTPSGIMGILTNASGSIRSRVSDSNATSYLRIATLGWEDSL